MAETRAVTMFPGGVIKAPPSKSAAHRAILCAGLALGESRIENLARSRDIDATAECVSVLRRGGATLECGESGSTLRFLLPVAAALSGGPYAFLGQGRLLDRPIGPYSAALGPHGVTLARRDGALVTAGSLRPGRFEVRGDVSSQFVSGLLFALPQLRGDSEILLTTPLQSKPYVDMTIGMMRAFGVTVTNEDHRRYWVRGGQSYRAAEIRVEGDYSQAAFFLVAGALGCPCAVAGLREDSLQGDRAIVELLRDFGASVTRDAFGALAARPGKLRARDVDISDIPDLAPPLAALMCFCEGTSRIVNAARLRHKESDRIASIAGALRALGAKVEEGGDYLAIEGRPALAGGTVDSAGDHRIAMMGAVAAARCTGQVLIRGADCVSKSYPNFWEDFEKTAREAAS